MNSKPDIHCITFGGGSKRFRAAAHRLARQAAASGFFTAATAVTDLELLEDEQFRAEHGAFAASNRRGFGYWIWKPYILLRKLRNVRDGDIVFYCDAGCEINPLGAKVFAEYVRLLQKNEVLLFRLSQLNEHWTKGDLLDLYPQLAGKRQFMSGIIGFRVCDLTRALAQAWYDLCRACNYRYLDDTKSAVPNHPGFVEHRHDQSCLCAAVSSACPSLAFLDGDPMELGRRMIGQPIIITRNKTGHKRTLTCSFLNYSFILYHKWGKKPQFVMQRRERPLHRDDGPDWLAARAYHALRAALASRGYPLPPSIDEPTRHESLTFIAETLRRKIPGLRSASFVRLYLQLIWRDAKQGHGSLHPALTLAARFPRSLAKLAREEIARKRYAWRMSRKRGGAKANAGNSKLAPFEHARIKVRCFGNWNDFDDALQDLTPGGRGQWDGVAFITSDEVRPDWVGIFNHPGRLPAEFAASPNRVFYAIGEPPVPEFHRLHVGQGEGSLVLTCDETLAKSSGQPRDYLLAPTFTRTWSVRRSYDELAQSDFPEKPKLLSWVTSDKVWLDGHRRRMDFLERLRSKIDFDLYGRGFTPLADKWDGIAPYRYSIAFENAQAPYYFTEKLMDCFVAGAMPLYFGSPEIGKFFPPDSMVVIDPDDPRVFEKIEEVIASDLWLERRGAIQEAKRLVLEEYNVFAWLARMVTTLDRPPAPVRHITVAPVRNRG